MPTTMPRGGGGYYMKVRGEKKYFLPEFLKRRSKNRASFIFYISLKISLAIASAAPGLKKARPRAPIFSQILEFFKGFKGRPADTFSEPRFSFFQRKLPTASRSDCRAHKTLCARTKPIGAPIASSKVSAGLLKGVDRYISICYTFT